MIEDLDGQVDAGGPWLECNFVLFDSYGNELDWTVFIENSRHEVMILGGSFVLIFFTSFGAYDATERYGDRNN
jgi:hypothetical protein